MQAKLGLAFLLATGSIGQVAAQPAVDQRKEQPLDAFLSQRVAEELATDGVLLSRLGVTLDIQIVGDIVIVSLVDSATSRAIASTKIDRITGDREAAVAQITQVAGNLAEQFAHGRIPEIANSDVDRAEKSRLAALEYQYQQEQVTFGASSEKWGDGYPNAPFVGTVQRPLTEAEFFRTVGRPDLADRYGFRYRGGIAIAVSGSLAVVGGMAVAIWDSPQQLNYRAATIGGLTATSLGLVAFAVGLFYASNPLPISKPAVYDLATRHNRKLREKYGLPVGIAPYAATDGGGVALRGGF